MQQQMIRMKRRRMRAMTTKIHHQSDRDDVPTIAMTNTQLKFNDYQLLR